MTPDFNHAFDLASRRKAAVSVFAYVRLGLAETAGSLLTTASVYDLSSMRSRRVWTDDHDAYPIGNFKRIRLDRYYQTVIEGKRPFSSTTIEEVASVFFDHEKIRSLGFESGMNLPAVADGEVIGTINLLHRQGHFTPERVAMAMTWQPIATMAFLLLRDKGIDTATFHGDAASNLEAVVEG